MFSNSFDDINGQAWVIDTRPLYAEVEKGSGRIVRFFTKLNKALSSAFLKSEPRWTMYKNFSPTNKIEN